LGLNLGNKQKNEAEREQTVEDKTKRLGYDF